jgi:predicted dithiol-disulfide oxidoreductase (DUF899 family)
MTETLQIAHPPIVSRSEWLEQRKALLVKEKELTRQRDRVNAERRRLPMVKIEKDYLFEGPEGQVRLVDLFAGCRQLLLQHFMFGPDWEQGCVGCTGFVDSLGKMDLEELDTRLVLVSRAPLAKLEAYKRLKGWDLPWYSSYGSDFNYDFHATHDPSIAPPEYNYQPAPGKEGEDSGLSVFFRLEDEVYHTYTTFARGMEGIADEWSLLDLTPYGRQQEFEDSPSGWPQRPTYWWTERDA